MVGDRRDAAVTGAAYPAKDGEYRGEPNVSGWFSGAAETLDRGDVAFVPAQDQLESDVSNPWTLRDALVVSAGCHRKAGLFAYWEWRSLVDHLNEAWFRIEAALDVGSAERWSNRSGRTKQEAIDVVRQVSADGDMDLPDAATLRPWCDPSLVRTCRVPFVPLAAVVHAWALRPGTVKELVRRLDVEATTDPWTLLDRAEAEIAFTDSPENVSEFAGVFRSSMAAQVPEMYSPAALLCEMASAVPTADLAACVNYAESFRSAKV